MIVVARLAETLQQNLEIYQTEVKAKNIEINIKKTQDNKKDADITALKLEKF